MGKSGKDGHLLQQHIVLKLWLLMSNSLGINQSQIRWKDWHVTTMDRLFFDGQGLFRNAPRHWTDMQRFISVAPEVPVSMHWHWMCLVSHSTGGKHPINPNGFAEKVCEFIEEGCEDDTQAGARAIFEAEHERLSASTFAVDELPDESAIDASAADCTANFRKRPKGSSQLSAKRKRQPSRPKQPRRPKCQHGS